MPYSPDQLDQLRDAFQDWVDRCDDLSTTILTRVYSNQRAKEFAVHGLTRRLNMLQHAMDRIFAAIPPEELSPDRTALMDATAFIQTFVINIYGAIDNLAHIWCAEQDVRDQKGRLLTAMRIGLTPRNEIVRASLPQHLQAYLAGFDAWFEYLESYRHALAHRIPLYIPPRRLGPDAESEFAALEAERSEAASVRDWSRFDQLGAVQDRLGSFEPYIMHSYGENTRPMRFHSQLICDLATVVEIGEYILAALDAGDPKGENIHV